MARGRKINVEARNRLELRDAADTNQAALAILKAAFEQRLALVAGQAVMLDSVVEIAHDTGYKGTLDQAAMILRREAGFLVEPGPSGRLTIRRAADFPRPEVEADFPHG